MLASDPGISHNGPGVYLGPNLHTSHGARTMENKIYKCAFCGIESNEAVASESWLPDFWLDEDTLVDRPCCETCVAEHLTNPMDSATVKEGHAEFLRESV